MAINTSFVNNPLVASLGGALGLGPILGEAADMDGANPGADPQAPKPAASKPNVPMYKTRPYVPPLLHAGGGVRPGVGTTAPAGATMDPAVLQNPGVQALLGQFGVSTEDTHPDGHLFIHNPEAFQNHPVIAGMLENGLSGLAAYQGTGRDTAETVGNIARSVLGADAMHAAQYNSQVQAPFQAAAQIAGLQKASLDQKNVQSEIDTRAQLANDKDYYQTQVIGAREDAIAARQQAHDAGLDPEIAGKQLYYQNAKAALVKQYGSEDKIPPAAILKLADNWRSSKDVAHQEAVQTTANARTTAAGISASARAQKIDQHLSTNDPEYKSLKDQYSRVDKEYSAMQNAPPAASRTIDGKQVMKGSTAWRNYLGQIAQRRSTLDSQLKNKINTTGQAMDANGGALPPTAPSGVNTNPFRH